MTTFAKIAWIILGSVCVSYFALSLSVASHPRGLYFPESLVDSSSVAVPEGLYFRELLLDSSPGGMFRPTIKETALRPTGLYQLGSTEIQSPPEPATVIRQTHEVFFDSGATVPEPGDWSDLRSINALLIARQIEIHGHADTKSTTRFNDQLSKTRAINARTQIARLLGIPESLIVTEHWGESKLKIDTPDETPERENRRVEIVTIY